MTHIINQARAKPSSLVIALLDLENEFDEAHQNEIQEVLSYHHNPEHIKFLVRNHSINFKTSTITHDFNTIFINIGCGVRQGDCQSHLLCNLCSNTDQSIGSSLLMMFQ